MEIRVLNKPIEVLVGEEDKYGFKLRQPTMGEMEQLLRCESNDESVKIIDALITEWVNKPKLVDEDKKTIKFETLTEFRDLTLSNELLLKAGKLLGEELVKKAEFTKK